MFDLGAVNAAITAHGPIARVVIAAVAGSSPREVGAAMLVWAQGQSGTIGGGALEFQAASRARDMLITGTERAISREALGPNLGQCCGGVVTLLTEVFDTKNLPDAEVFARPLDNTPMPLGVSRMLAQARTQGYAPEPCLVQGWMVEPIAKPTRPLWIWGAGHVGRALVHTLVALPDLAITWVDVAADRFPDAIADGVTMLPATDPARLMPRAPHNAEHLILTYSHTLDLALCHAALTHGFAQCGLIGSKTKWARFRSRLATLGHSAQSLSRITCPIGDPRLGKHPQAIAIGVAAQILHRYPNMSQEKARV